MDFVHDQLATGRKLHVLTILDIFSRFSPALEPRFNFSGADVVRVLEGVCKEVGFPATIRVDQGSEFVSRDLDLWAYQRGVTLDFSRPGKPTDNAFIESFNGKFRTECLNAHLVHDPRTTADENARLGVETTMEERGQRHAAYPDRSALNKGRQQAQPSYLGPILEPRRTKPTARSGPCCLLLWV